MYFIMWVMGGACTREPLGGPFPETSARPHNP